jgi:hypothetical protein
MMGSVNKQNRKPGIVERVLQGLAIGWVIFFFPMFLFETTAHYIYAAIWICIVALYLFVFMRRVFKNGESI